MTRKAAAKPEDAWIEATPAERAMASLDMALPSVTPPAELWAGIDRALAGAQVIALAEPPAALRWAMGINALRWSLARRIVDAMGGRSGGLGAAMVVRFRLPTAANERQRRDEAPTPRA